MSAFIIAGALISWGLYGIIKKKMISPTALRAGERYKMEAAKNIPFSEQPQIKNYFIYGTWAVFEGIILILIGVAIIFANL